MVFNEHIPPFPQHPDRGEVAETNLASKLSEVADNFELFKVKPDAHLLAMTRIPYSQDTSTERFLHAQMVLENGNYLSGAITLSAPADPQTHSILKRGASDARWDGKFTNGGLLRVLDRQSPYRYENPEQDKLIFNEPVSDLDVFSYLSLLRSKAEMTEEIKSYLYHQIDPTTSGAEERSFTRVDISTENNGLRTLHATVGMPFEYNYTPGVLVAEIEVDPLDTVVVQCRFTGGDFSKALIPIDNTEQFLALITEMLDNLQDEKLGIHSAMNNLDDELQQLGE